jgi:hypothetical protein
VSPKTRRKKLSLTVIDPPLPPPSLIVVIRHRRLRVMLVSFGLVVWWQSGRVRGSGATSRWLVVTWRQCRVIVVVYGNGRW